MRTEYCLFSDFFLYCTRIRQLIFSGLVSFYGPDVHSAFTSTVDFALSKLSAFNLIASMHAGG